MIRSLKVMVMALAAVALSALVVTGLTDDHYRDHQVEVTLQQAAKLEAVNLTSKGGTLGDQVTFATDGATRRDYVIEVRRGDLLLSKNPHTPNLVVTRSFYAFVPAGHEAKLRGVYVASLDPDKKPPQYGDVYDVGPNVGDWPMPQGTQMSHLLQLIDAYGWSNTDTAQQAVWNLTSGYPVEGMAAALVRAIGVNPDADNPFPQPTNPHVQLPRTSFVMPYELLGTGDVQATLIWGTTADFDLMIVDPNGERISWLDPRAKSGGELDQDDRCAPISHGGPENIYWSEGAAPLGQYKVIVKYYATCGGSEGPTSWSLRLYVDGEVKKFDGTLEPLESTVVTTFTRDWP